MLRTFSKKKKHVCKNIYRLPQPIQAHTQTLRCLRRFYPQPFWLSLHLPKLWLWLIHSGVTHLLVSQCFERATPFTTTTPSTFSPVMAEQRCVGWWALWKRDCGHTQPHTGTHKRDTQKAGNKPNKLDTVPPWGFNSYFMCYYGLKEEAVSQGCWWNMGFWIEVPLCHRGVLFSCMLVIHFLSSILKARSHRPWEI